MILWAVLYSAFWLGVLTSISPCPLATNIAAISFLGKSVGNTRKVLLSGLLYTLGRTFVYVSLGMLILLAFESSMKSEASRFLQKYMGIVLGPLLILVGMMLLGMLKFSGSINLAGKGLQDRVAGGSLIWSLLLGILFALSFCPLSASLFFGSLIGLSSQHSAPIMLPTVYGIGTAMPVIAFAFIIAFASQHIGKAFNILTKLERWFRVITGVVFIGSGIYSCLTYIYGVSLF